MHKETNRITLNSDLQGNSRGRKWSGRGGNQKKNRKGRSGTKRNNEKTTTESEKGRLITLFLNQHL